ncbi:tetratricopeptide repeat protein [Candidatus Daviesbacteria bacterium]|nr:tetratricopeptide repeat protein [Candidatus Daviesbacteria bacterium]
MEVPSSDSNQIHTSNLNLDLGQLAIDAALRGDWLEAETLNKKIIKEDPNNTASLNRLARALFELGKYQQAKKIYQKVLEIDPYNPIAAKNLKRTLTFKKNEPKFSGDGQLQKNSLNETLLVPSLFLEEAGITKVVSLVKLAEPQKISKLYAGSPVILISKNRCISITDSEGNYLGVLPDDISHHLLRLIKGGNKYSAIIKSVKPNSLSLLIRENFRAKKFRNQPSFIDSSHAITYSSDNITLNYDEGSEEIVEQEVEEV